MGNSIIWLEVHTSHAISPILLLIKVCLHLIIFRLLWTFILEMEHIVLVMETSYIFPSGSTGTRAIYSLFLLDIYWKHNWYISVLPKIDQLTFSAPPPFYPVPCNHSLTGFKPGRTIETRLWVVGLNNYLNTCIVCQLARWYIK